MGQGRRPPKSHSEVSMGAGAQPGMSGSAALKTCFWIHWHAEPWAQRNPGSFLHLLFIPIVQQAHGSHQGSPGKASGQPRPCARGQAVAGGRRGCQADPGNPRRGRSDRGSQAGESSRPGSRGLRPWEQAHLPVPFLPHTTPSSSPAVPLTQFLPPPQPTRPSLDSSQSILPPHPHWSCLSSNHHHPSPGCDAATSL